jgi:hypothetical protein
MPQGKIVISRKHDLAVLMEVKAASEIQLVRQ